MATAVYEKRSFTNQVTGEIIGYDFYGIVGIDSNGERMELPLKSLNAAEKLAFKVVAATSNVTDGEPLEVTTSSKGGSVQVSRKTQSDNINLEEDDEPGGGLFD